MTRQEAIEMLKSKMDGDTDTSYEWAETVRMAIKALEEQENPNSIRINFIGEKEAKEFDKYLKNQQPKESIIDKIRAEIKALSNANPSYWHSGDMVEREEVFEIIDKYIAESEVE